MGREHAASVLWMITEALLNTQAMTIYSTLAKPREAAAAATVEEGRSQENEEPANHTPSSH